MANVARRRRTPVEEDTIPDSIYESLGNKATADPKAKTQEPSVADLMERIGALSQQVEDLQREPPQPIVVQAPVAQREQPKEPTLNLDGLPDPVTDPKNYGVELARRTVAYQKDMSDFATKQANANKPAVPAGDFDALWDEFVSAYPEYAVNESRMKFTLGEVAARMGRKGIDVQQYALRRSDQFFKDIVKEYDGVFGKPEGEDEPAPTTQRTERKTAKNPDGDDEGRSESIFGGGDNPGGVREGAAKPKAGDFIKDLTDLQRGSGYF